VDQIYLNCLSLVFQSWLRHLILYTSEFYEGRWTSLQVLPQDFILRGTSDPTFSAFLGNTFAYTFADAASNEVYFTLQLPESWSGEENITPYVRWSPTDTGSGNVRWELEYTKAKPGTVFPATTTITAEGSTNSTDDEHLKTEFAVIDADGDDVNTLFSFRLIRNGGHGNDTYGAAAALHSIGFLFLTDSLGTTLGFSKNKRGT
jgi:hypothetical protein